MSYSGVQKQVLYSNQSLRRQKYLLRMFFWQEHTTRSRKLFSRIALTETTQCLKIYNC